MVIEAIVDAAADILRILPFLFLTYLAMEFLEHKAGDRAQYLVRKAGRLGPLAGGMLGVFPSVRVFRSGIQSVCGQNYHPWNPAFGFLVHIG